MFYHQAMTIIENQITANIKPKIVLLDDEVDTLEALERLLRGDFKVFKATSSAQALEILQSHPDTSVILSDHRMPEGLGTEFLLQAKAKVPNAVRAILTGQMDLKDLVKAVNEVSVHRLILKPWDNDFLKVQMLECWQYHRLLQEKNFFEQLSTTDPVTHLSNHRYFQVQLKMFVERSKRHNYPLSLIMVDVDHFKNFNDQFGHPEGDKILSLVARRLQAEVRNIDLVARYGGDEFAVILPDTPLSKANEVSERIRKSFDVKSFAGPDSRPVTVTISLGVAGFPDHGKSPSDLIVAADTALFQAKRQGRNQSRLAGMPT